MAAVQQQAARSLSVTAPTELEIALAEELKRRLAGIERICFTNSGTEATMLALRAARSFTGRAKIAKFDVGSHDYVALDPPTVQPGTPESITADGIPSLIAETILTLPYNDPEGVERILSRQHCEVAALIVEPVIGAGGILLPQEGFLRFTSGDRKKRGLSSWHTRSCVLIGYSVGSPGLTFVQTESIIRLSYLRRYHSSCP